MNKIDLKKVEQPLYSKVIVPFPLKHNGIIFKTKIEINKKSFLQNNFQLNDFENLSLCFAISNQNSKVDLKIELNLKIEDENLIKVNYINYKEEKFSIIDYFGGIVQFLPFLRIINELYKNIKILDKIGKIDFLIDFSNTILLIIFNHLNNSGFEKQENFTIYWNFYFYLLNKIELFQDKEMKIDVNQFSLHKFGNNNNSKNNEVYFEMFKNFLEFATSKKKDFQNELKNKFAQIVFNGKEDDFNISNISLFSKTNEQLYKHLMKQLFIYNRLWSRQHLFFQKIPNCYNNKDKNIKIKYKRINNYTCNYQQPLIYPILEINKYYPKFKRFKLDNLYKENHNEIILNYDFSLDIYKNTLDKQIVENYLDNNNVTNSTIKCCLIKKMYHIKGEIGAISDLKTKSNNKIFFISNFGEKKICNIGKQKNELKDCNSKLCYGSVFQCLEKEKKRLLVIPIDKILFVLLRVYYYKNTGLEIFTIDNKSYYFNFWDDLKIDGKHIIIKIFEDNFKLIKDKKKQALGWYNNDYIDLFLPLFNEDIFTWNKKNFFYSNFDKLMIINLFSNRSFNDLYQYPIFPMLYNELGLESNRNMEQHIGFQELTEESKERKQLLQDSYFYAQTYDQGESKEDKYYFNIMYSNITFTCNYLIRVFPYSFIAIEYQGDGFDDPNRLFYSIKVTLTNTLNQRGDLRELIPEMFYFPPLFYNINDIELKKLSNGKGIDLVNIEDYNEGDLRKYIFLKDMRKYLEEAKINSWIDLIFGIKKDYYKGNERYYKIQNNITFNFDIEKYNYDLLMQEYDFGVLPIQILTQKFPENPKISDKLKEEIFKLNKNQFNKEHIACSIEGKESFICKGEKGINKQYLNIINKIQNKNAGLFEKAISYIYINNPNKNSNLKYLFIGDVFGNLSVYEKIKKNKEDPKSMIKEVGKDRTILNRIKNYKLIKSLNDHTDVIKYIDYNPRLNLVIDYGLDGYMNLYTMPNLKLILSIQVKDYSIKDPVNYVLLISNPFPMICCINLEYIVIFDINGKFVNKVVLEEPKQKISFNIDKNCGLFNDSIINVVNNEEKEYALIPNKNSISSSIKSN